MPEDNTFYSLLVHSFAEVYILGVSVNKSKCLELSYLPLVAIDKIEPLKKGKMGNALSRVLRNLALLDV